MFVCVCLCVCVCVGGLLIEAPPRAIWDVLTNYNQVFFYLYFQFCFIFFLNNKCDLGCVSKYNQVHFLSLIFFEYNRISSNSPLPFM